MYLQGKTRPIKRESPVGRSGITNEETCVQTVAKLKCAMRIRAGTDDHIEDTSGDRCGPVARGSGKPGGFARANSVLPER